MNHLPPSPLPVEGGDCGSQGSQFDAAPALGRPGGGGG